MSRTLFVGDVHGCAHELERLLQKARPSRVILVGDLFTRGPDPRAVWELIDTWGIEAVLGNHDHAVLQSWRPGKPLPKRALRWLARRPAMLEGPGWVAVHAGIDPKLGPRRTSRKQAMGLRQLPRTWWQDYRGKRLVIHGHHARGGLHDQRPFTLGLDTDCVRGGRLTGYLLEKDRIMSVRSRQSCTV